MSIPNGPARGLELEAVFGPLEARVLDALWTLDRPSTVRDLRLHFPAAAYTTLMTTLDRLHRKGILLREKEGRAFAYRHRWTRQELLTQITGQTLGALLVPHDPALQPLVSFFVDAVTRRDADVLEELERLIARRREEEPRT